MVYICLDCGNIESFRANRDVTEYHTEEVYIDGDGSIEDYGDSEVNDTESDDDFRDIECQECDSSNVEYRDEDGIDELRRGIIERNGDSLPEDLKPNTGKSIVGDL